MKRSPTEQVRLPRSNDTWLRALCARCGVYPGWCSARRVVTLQACGDHVHVHAFRRTTISMLLDAGNSLATVSSWIGHSSVAMTNH